MSQTSPEKLAKQRSTASESSPARESAGNVEWRKTLELWLRWNEAHEKVTSKLFQNGAGQQQVEDLMDQLERMRLEAVNLSERLID